MRTGAWGHEVYRCILSKSRIKPPPPPSYRASVYWKTGDFCCVRVPQLSTATPLECYRLEYLCSRRSTAYGRDKFQVQWSIGFEFTHPKWACLPAEFRQIGPCTKSLIPNCAAIFFRIPSVGDGGQGNASSMCFRSQQQAPIYRNTAATCQLPSR